jgi:VWFA-related protein
MNHRPWYILFSVLVALSASALPQQDPGPPPVGETVEVTLINVDVHVTDKNGNRVHGLTRDDFTIVENGVPQPISNFSEYRESPGADTPGAVIKRNTRVEAPRSVVVFVDDLKVHPSNAKPVFETIRQTLRRTIRKGDAVSVVRWYTSLETLVEFTDDMGSIDRALDDVQKRASRPYDLRSDPRLVTPDQRPRYLSNTNPLPGSGDRDVRFARQQAFEEKQKLVRKIAAINATIQTLSSGDGKKAMLLVTDRLSAIAGADRFYAAGIDDIPSRAGRELDMRDEINSIISSANANGVTIYPIHPEGMTQTTGDAANGGFNPGYDLATLSNETPSLVAVAEGTGGVAAWGSRDIPRKLPAMADDFSSYYSLAYRVSTRREDRTRDVTVMATNPRLVVRARRSFVERSEPTKMRDRVTATLFRQLTDASFPIAVETGEPRAQGRKTIIPLTVRIPIGALTPLPQDDGTYTAWISVWATHASKADDAATPSSERRTFKIAAGELEKASAGYMIYTVDVSVPRDADRLAVGVLDEVSKAYGLTRVPVGPAQKAGL